LATDYLAVGLTLTFICGIIFLVLGFNEDENIGATFVPRAVIYHMFSALAWLATTFQLWMSGTASIVGIPWLFMFFFLISFTLVIIESIQAFRVATRQKRGYET